MQPGLLESEPATEPQLWCILASTPPSDCQGVPALGREGFIDLPRDGSVADLLTDTLEPV